MFGREGASVLTPLFRLQIPNDTSRKIIHVDMDAFYASIEMRDDPSLRTRALVIAHDPRQTGGKGVITTANYVARQYGVNSAMPAIEAVRKVPRRLLVFKDPDFEKYHAVSDQIHDIFHQVTDLIEPIALDEAYLDVTNNTHFPTTIALALWLQQTIERQTRLTCAIGVSYNRFLAKMASEFNKPGGRTVVTPGMAQEFWHHSQSASFVVWAKRRSPGCKHWASRRAQIYWRPTRGCCSVSLVRPGSCWRYTLAALITTRLRLRNVSRLVRNGPTTRRCKARLPSARS